MPNWELHIEGQVQGVGFRPLVYRVARERGLRGTVSNGPDGVRIHFSGSEEEARSFRKELRVRQPVAARITGVHFRKITGAVYPDFRIVDSELTGSADTLLTPDLGLCADCRADLTRPNRRRGYAFTTCTNCGPRYSLVNALPYDRPRTEMAAFPMCSACEAEYQDPTDRRYFSQTNSCPDCGITLAILGDDTARGQDAVIAYVAERWRAGDIVAIKGIGGYLLTCDAGNPATIARLRERKHRPDKPLALMYPNPEQVQADFHATKHHLELLGGLSAPIVLLSPKHTLADVAVAAVAPGLSRLGILLPYAPLYQLLLNAFNRPIVATSGNRSGEPIVFRDTDAAAELGGIADLILTHDRPILLPQDDSVMAYTRYYQPVFLRRARGFAPTFICRGAPLPTQHVFAAGADVKAAFGLQQSGNTYLSQYLGDLGSFTTQQNYRHTLTHLSTVLQATPEVVLTDLHPKYVSTQLAETLAQERNLPVVRIQHHEAHFAAVLAESGVADAPDGSPVLGVIWDGTGYGHDGAIWGGEFFRYANGAFTRIGHLDYFPQLAGDKLAREPRLAALALAGDLPEAQAFLQEKFTLEEWRVYRRLRETTSLRSASMGRLFDAVASLLGVADHQSYEGMAAARLEDLARTGFSQHPRPRPYALVLTERDNIPTRRLLSALLQDHLPPAVRAARFHCTLVDCVRQMAARQGVVDLAFSGGVFQNVLLVELIEEALGKSYHLHFHHQVSPNDEGIALGQLAHYALQQRRSAPKLSTHVLSHSR
ncbi:MAG: carbamoyltransferase HypF [Bacteroidota bacterium]